MLKRLIFLCLLISASIAGAAQDLKKGPLNLISNGSGYLLSIPDSILEQHILVVNRFSKGSARTGENDQSMYQGSEANESVIKFSINSEGKMLMQRVINKFRSKELFNTMYRSVMTANEQPVLASFDIIKVGAEKNKSLIDFSAMLTEDPGVFSLSGLVKKMYNLEAVQANASYLKRVERFPEGMDMIFTKTYSTAESAKTFELNSSMLLLPKKSMTPRFSDGRVTEMIFNTIKYSDFDKNPFFGETVGIAERFRMEPKSEDIPKYLRGELVEPKKPIIFYLDPNTPKEWIPYFTKGVNAWQKGFEKAGFKNAIYMKLISEADTNFNFVSSRYNTICYLPSNSFGATASHNNDQRSGEALTARVMWPHGSLRHLRNQYMVQAGAVDHDARKAVFSTELYGELIAFVVAHEVGHTLGIHHNYMASATVPVDSLRNKVWVERHGISPSVMDYSRNNYVAQPGDAIGREGMIGKVGEYDEWAVEWLYRWYPDQNPVMEKQYLDSLYTRKVDKNLRLRYLNVDKYRDDVRIQSEDLGDDPVKASEYGIKNLKYVVPNIPKWTKQSPTVYNYETARDVYATAFEQFNEYVKHVSNLIGGATIDINEINSVSRRSSVSVKDQKKALNFLCRHLFDTPEWLIDPKLWSKLEIISDDHLSPVNLLLHSQTTVLNAIFDLRRLDRLMVPPLTDSSAYSMDEICTDLDNGIFSELKNHGTINIYRRNLQKNYLIILLRLVSQPSGADPNLFDASSIAKAHLRQINSNISKKLKTSTDHLTKIHLADLSERIMFAINASGRQEQVK
jgi:hypothetical protein